jgi:hypothetical protein
MCKVKPEGGAGLLFLEQLPPTWTLPIQKHEDHEPKHL